MHSAPSLASGVVVECGWGEVVSGVDGIGADGQEWEHNTEFSCDTEIESNGRGCECEWVMGRKGEQTIVSQVRSHLCVP